MLTSSRRLGVMQDVREWCIDEVLIPPRFCNIPIPHSLVNLCVSQVWVTELIEFWGSYTSKHRNWRKNGAPKTAQAIFDDALVAHLFAELRGEE